MVGFTLALGPFDHVVVTFLHVLLGVWLGASAGYGDLLAVLLLATAGNLAGGLLLITLTHTAQVEGEQDSPGVTGPCERARDHRFGSGRRDRSLRASPRSSVRLGPARPDPASKPEIIGPAHGSPNSWWPDSTVRPTRWLPARWHPGRLGP